MGKLANQDIRDACKENNVTLWQVAEQLGYADTTLSKHLRRELPDSKKREILDIIKQLGTETAVDGDGK